MSTTDGVHHRRWRQLLPWGPISRVGLLVVGALAGLASAGVGASRAAPVMPAFAAAPDVTVSSRVFSLATGDFTGDGRPDFVTANFNAASASIRLGDGHGGFVAAPDVPLGPTLPAGVTVGDFNGDGRAGLHCDRLQLWPG